MNAVICNPAYSVSGLSRARLRRAIAAAALALAATAAVGCTSDSSVPTLPLTPAQPVAGSPAMPAPPPVMAPTPAPAAPAQTPVPAPAPAAPAPAPAPPPPAGPPGSLSELFQSVFATSCMGCHSKAPADADNGKLGMIMNKQAFFDAVVNKPAAGPGCMARGTLVVPFQSTQSILFQKLGSVPPCGMRMPLMGMLTAEQVTKFERWIDTGAKND